MTWARVDATAESASTAPVRIRLPVVIACRPPTLLKGQPWHDVPDGRPQWVLRVGAPIDPARYLDAGSTLPVAARRLTADLQALYEQGLGADEEHS